MSEETYNPLEHSIVQALLKNDRMSSFEATDFHEALLFAIAREIGRVHWNRYQTKWDRWSDDPKIPGIHWRCYRYECGCPEEDDFVPRHDEDCIQSQPHFRFDGVEFDWYKYPGRGMSMNKDMSEAEWREWFDRCLAKIREYDTDPLDEEDRADRDRWRMT